MSKVEELQQRGLLLEGEIEALMHELGQSLQQLQGLKSMWCIYRMTLCYDSLPLSEWVRRFVHLVPPEWEA